MGSIEASWSDREWAGWLASSTDPDDQSLSARLFIVEHLKAKRVRNQREEQMLALLSGMNQVELAFLRQPYSCKGLQKGRPCWPRWHWREELVELYHRTNGSGQ